MSHSITSRRAGDAPAPARETDRIASGAQAGAQGPPHVDALSVAPLLVAARAPQRGRELEARHQPVELRELVRLERVEALAPQQLLVARHRERHLDLGAVLVAPRRAATTTRGPPSRRARPCARDAGRSSGGAATVRIVLGLERPRPRSAAEDREEHRVEGLDLRRVGHEHGAGGPVQPPARDRPDERERACEARPSAPGVIGTPTSCRRRLNAPTSGGRSSSIVSTPNAGAQSPARTSWSRPAARITSWSSSYFSTEPSVRSTAAASRLLDAEQAQRRQPVDRLGDARRLLHVARRACARRRSRPAPRASPTRP